MSNYGQKLRIPHIIKHGSQNKGSLTGAPCYNIITQCCDKYENQFVAGIKALLKPS